MHIVFLNQYYPPDPAPTGVMLAAVVKEMAIQGHKVTVICSKGEYVSIASKNQSIEIHPPSIGEKEECLPVIITIGTTCFGRRFILGKILDYLSYYLGAVWKIALIQKRPDRIIALTTPPYLSLLARIMSRLRGADHAHWIMDLYPDVMVAHGMLKNGGVIHRLLEILAVWGFSGKRCAAVLTLGPDMEKRIKSLTVKSEQPDNHSPKSRALNEYSEFNSISWIPLWSEVDQYADHLAITERRHEMGWEDEELIVMYSGNMGLGHLFKEILEVIGETHQGHVSESNTDLPIQLSSSTRFVFFGEGKRRKEISDFIKKHPEAPVEIHDYAPTEILANHLRSADLHLVSLDAAWTGTMLPSKLQGIFSVGRPVIFIGDANSSIGSWVTQSKGGWVVQPGDISALKDAIYEAHDPLIRESRGRAAKAFSKANFDKQTNVKKVVDILISSGLNKPV